MGLMQATVSGAARYGQHTSIAIISQHFMIVMYHFKIKHWTWLSDEYLDSPTYTLMNMLTSHSNNNIGAHLHCRHQYRTEQYHDDQ